MDTRVVVVVVVVASSTSTTRAAPACSRWPARGKFACGGLVVVVGLAAPGLCGKCHSPATRLRAGRPDIVGGSVAILQRAHLAWWWQVEGALAWQ